MNFIVNPTEEPSRYEADSPMIDSSDDDTYHSAHSADPSNDEVRETREDHDEYNLPHVYLGSEPRTSGASSSSSTSTFTAKTMLQGHNSMLVDLGSKINIVGRDTAPAFVNEAKKHNLPSRIRKRVKPLYVNGVGAGSAPCRTELEVPVGVKYENTAAAIHPYQANIAEGSGKNLPAILGKDTMVANDAVLLLRQGKQLMAFPGPGGYKIEWSPGTRLLPMEDSPSGHTVIRCDHFTDATRTASATTFTTDYTDQGVAPTP